MTTPSITTSLPYPSSLGRALRVALVALAIVVLGVVAFVAERAASGGGAPGVSSHIQAPATASDPGTVCQYGHLRVSC